MWNPWKTYWALALVKGIREPHEVKKSRSSVGRVTVDLIRRSWVRGKDVCDRKTAAMKARIRKWVDERHDGTTAEDMKQALESHGGLRRCREAVVEVDTTKAIGNDNKIPGTSQINHFLFEEGGIRAWMGYNVGPGHHFANGKLSFKKQGDTGLREI